MKDVNKIILMGRLGADPVLKEIKNGLSVTQFPLATSRRVKKEEGEPVQETQWHRVYTWGKQAETCAQYLKKGEPVYVEGMIRTRKYQTKAGEDRYSFEVHADSVNFLGSLRGMTPGVETAVAEAAS